MGSSASRRVQVGSEHATISELERRIRDAASLPSDGSDLEGKSKAELLEEVVAARGILCAVVEVLDSQPKQSGSEEEGKEQQQQRQQQQQQQQQHGKQHHGRAAGLLPQGLRSFVPLAQMPELGSRYEAVLMAQAGVENGELDSSALMAPSEELAGALKAAIAKRVSSPGAYREFESTVQAGNRFFREVYRGAFVDSAVNVRGAQPATTHSNSLPRPNQRSGTRLRARRRKRKRFRSATRSSIGSGASVLQP